jgi:K+-transporting ATPase ATPase C chain
MKQQILPAVRLTLVCILVFMVAYPLVIWTAAQIAPAKGKGEAIVLQNNTVGYRLEGQAFTRDNYFWGRPSAAGYNAAGSTGSNKGPSNPDYLKEVNARIDSFLIHNPGIERSAIPAELVTASGSGLDPHISPQAALVQVKRVSAFRHIPEEQVRQLVHQHTETPFLGVFGTSVVNVLPLNIALDQLKKER